MPEPLKASASNRLQNISVTKAIIFSAISLAMICLNLLLTKKFTTCNKGISILSILVILAVCFTGFVFSDTLRDEKRKRFLKGTAVVCLTAFGMETLIFNFKSFSSDNTRVEYDTYSAISINNTDNATVMDNSMEIRDAVELTVDLNKSDIHALQLTFDGEGDTPFRCYVSIKDGNFSRQFIKVGERSASANYGKCDFSFCTYEKLQAVQIGFTEIQEPVTLTGIYFSTALPFSFSEARFYVLFLLMTGIWAIWIFQLYRMEYDRSNPKHRAVIVVLTVVCASSALFFIDPKAKDIAYTKGMNVSGQNPYVQMFDALQNHRASIGIEPSEELLAMENPYDSSLRSAEGVAFAWDRAFYNGKYYSYYGIAPVLTFYYPYYYLHSNKLPSMNKACVFFGVLSVVFLFGTVMAFIRKFLKRPNFLLVVLLLIASMFASGICFMVNVSDMYALPGVTGTCYMTLCLWTGLEAYIRRGEKKQIALFAVSGFAFALCVASKPTRALSCLILAPAFLEILFCKNRKAKEKIVSACSFLLPAFVGLGGLMAYNYARFGSPFDFGAAYQLTVSNVNANQLRLSLIPDAVMHYFFQPVKMTGAFPFVEIGSVHFANPQAYIYSEFAVGAFSMPLIAAGLSVLPFLLYHQRRKKGEKFEYNTVNVKNATYILMFLMAVFLAWFNYCVAGIILSYVCDILPLLTLLSVFVLLEASHIFSEGVGMHGKYVCFMSIVSCTNTVLVLLELLSFNGLALNHHMPDILYVLEDLLCFWN